MWTGIFKQIFDIRYNKYLPKKLRVHCLYNKQWEIRRLSVSRAQLSQKATTLNATDSLYDIVSFRQKQARRSILVQVQSARSYKELYAYCNNIGTVKHMFHYTTGVEPLHFILIEFISEEDVKNVLSSSCHLNDDQAVPVISPFLWFRVSPKKKSLKVLAKDFKLDVENGNKIPSTETTAELLRKTDSISEQMQVLYNTTKLNDLGTRLRFLTAHQVEIALKGMFPNAIAYPFGSSVNGFGKMGCDLDLILILNPNKELQESRLVFQCKESVGHERSQSQRHMEAIGDLLQLFLPGCSQVRRILQARIPILKYNQQFTDIECDLSMSNMIAFNMSELLYLYGSLDERVRPLVFTIRKWAQEVGLTNNSPGRWITNFSLSLLVLSFLQRSHYNSPLILPSVNKLEELAKDTKKDLSQLNCAYKIPENKLPKNDNKNTLYQLLLEFFEYYAKYDFLSRAISLNEAKDLVKPEHAALYIINPLEKGLNVSKNVSPEELERLRVHFRNAAWILESAEKNSGKWGILSLFYSNKLSNKKHNMVLQSNLKQNRIMNVSALFDEKEIFTENQNVYKNETLDGKLEHINTENKENLEKITDVKSKRRKQNTFRR